MFPYLAPPRLGTGETYRASGLATEPIPGDYMVESRSQESAPIVYE